MLIRIDQCCFAGGTLAIYSLLCRHAKVKLIPNQHRSDEDLTTYSRTVSAEGSFAAKTKKWLEGKEWRKRALLVVVLLGTCMMIGDGILTPAISGKASLLSFSLRFTKKMIIVCKNNFLQFFQQLVGSKSTIQK